ncbi:MAG TPA: CocE/NonD family hydrolase, partial [Steroidobacteraceae bacterium]|nr:CocE/NonD family hydrolase [Steroidobacteraceae bacterium]
MKWIMLRAGKVIALLYVLVATRAFAQAQDVAFHAPSPISAAALDTAIPDLANRLLASNNRGNTRFDSQDLFWIEIAANKNAQAYTTIRNWRAEHGYSNGSGDGASIVPLELYADAESRVAESKITFDGAFRASFRTFFAALDNKGAYTAMAWLGAPPLEAMRNQLTNAVGQLAGKDRIAATEAIDLCRRYALIKAYQVIAPLTDALIGEDRANRYVINDDALIKTPDGATINAIVVRPRAETKLPAALQFTIYTYPWMLSSAIEAAAHGYVGVVGFARGKRHSPDAVVPYERDGDDTVALIEWISRQSWSDGRVGMYGASYNGFTQWAAVKHRPAALKTIVPYCPNDPGYGLPMTNNVFLTANYAWPFYVTNGKDLDEQLYSDNERWSTLGWKWYRSGRPYREIDQVDGLANPWLHRWLKHPAYDSYWQAMTANGGDYATLDIPVLAIDGYFDDGQNNAVRRLQEHYRFRPNAEHYLVIGPYDHIGVRSSNKPPVLRGYSIDPVAQFDTTELTFEWFDHVFKDGAKPALLEDRINYEVMGANVWRHAPSIEKMSSESLMLYLTNAPAADDFYRLAPTQPTSTGAIEMTVDFKDRSVVSANTYPSEIVTHDLQLSRGVAFVSDPFDAPIAVSGLFRATLRAVVNKKDLDIAMVLYEVLPSGEYFHLSDTIQRASYAADMTQRRLL